MCVGRGHVHGNSDLRQHIDPDHYSLWQGYLNVCAGRMMNGKGNRKTRRKQNKIYWKDSVNRNWCECWMNNVMTMYKVFFQYYNNGDRLTHMTYSRHKNWWFSPLLFVVGFFFAVQWSPQALMNFITLQKKHMRCTHTQNIHCHWPIFPSHDRNFNVNSHSHTSAYGRASTYAIQSKYATLNYCDSDDDDGR